MDKVSIFEIFKIGIGPSSSHAMGPWKAAADFLATFIRDGGDLFTVQSVQITLFGSLAKTGRGHGTDKALIMGLSGYSPQTTPTSMMREVVDKCQSSGQINLLRQRTINFDPATDIIFNMVDVPRSHANTMDCVLKLENDQTIEATYYSIGGGFIERKGEISDQTEKAAIPYPAQSAAEMMAWCESEHLSVAQVSHANELVWQTTEEIETGLDNIWGVMVDSIFEGIQTEGELPGGLGVQRRAAKMSQKLLMGQTYETRDDWLALLANQPRDMNRVTQWISCFALAVNEVNASYGRIVTAPTNGAAGVIPAVLMYLKYFHDDVTIEDIKSFLLVAGEIGILFKKGATISAAAGGCQAEIGVSSAMAAGALTFALGGDIEQLMMAAEIAMEHHLGLSCDPIGGLVQIPCIERNTMGAMKAITAAQLALNSDPKHAKVSLDDVIVTMWETAKDMNSKYKETSEGGLAIQVSLVEPEC